MGRSCGLAGESGCGKTTLGTSLIQLTGRMRYIKGKVLLDGQELPIWDNHAMNEYRFKAGLDRTAICHECHESHA
jgi:peptide/nickel transport system ATP-binding protein